jgi:ABC-type uncharacterized transport system fused permease/ATPase subunit
MSPDRMLELLDSQAAAIEKLQAELAEAEAEFRTLLVERDRLSDEVCEQVAEANEQAELVTRWASIAHHFAGQDRLTELNELIDAYENDNNDKGAA